MNGFVGVLLSDEVPLPVVAVFGPLVGFANYSIGNSTQGCTIRH
jgi:hypothetical protein